MRRSAPGALLLVIPWLHVACGDRGDGRFSSPERTIETLLGACGVRDAVGDAMRERLRSGCPDPATYRACFSDFDDATDEGLAGFVLGTLSERTGGMRVNVVGDRAHVFPDPSARSDRSVVLVKQGDDWKISLAASVPAAVQREMRRLREQFE